MRRRHTASPMKQAPAMGRRLLSALLCLALALGGFALAAQHTPKAEALYDYAQTVAEHGHSHGFEDDVRWALHGHAHDAADHDHSQAVLMLAGEAGAYVDGDTWTAGRPQGPPGLIFRIERPPRA